MKTVIILSMSKLDSRYRDRDCFIGKEMKTKDFQLFKFRYKKDAINYAPYLPINTGYYFMKASEDFKYKIID